MRSHPQTIIVKGYSFYNGALEFFLPIWIAICIYENWLERPFLGAGKVFKEYWDTFKLYLMDTFQNFLRDECWPL